MHAKPFAKYFTIILIALCGLEARAIKGHARTKSQNSTDLISGIERIQGLHFVTSIPLANPLYETYHPQGVKVIGKDVYLSTVEGVSTGFGHVLHYTLDSSDTPTTAEAVGRVTFDPGPEHRLIHAGGVDEDGGSLLVPLAVYNRAGPAKLMRLDLKNFGVVTEVLDISDHIGAVVRFTGSTKMFNWDARDIYSFDDGALVPAKVLGGSGWRYQDCKHVDDEYALCSALNGIFIIDGEVQLVHLSERAGKVSIAHSIPVARVFSDGTLGGFRALTYNAMDFTPIYSSVDNRLLGVRFYFVPHDGQDTHLMIYDATF